MTPIAAWLRLAMAGVGIGLIAVGVGFVAAYALVRLSVSYTVRLGLTVFLAGLLTLLGFMARFELVGRVLYWGMPCSVAGLVVCSGQRCGGHARTATTTAGRRFCLSHDKPCSFG